MKKLKTLDESNKIALLNRDDYNKPRLNGIECPNCKNELFDSNPHFVLSTYPPSQHIHCANCSYKGTRFFI